MNLNNNIIKPLEYTGYSLKILDQRLLPSQEIYLEFTEADEIIKAMKAMIVRGAPAIGLAGAWACCLAAKNPELKDNENQLIEKFEEIKEARPTAVNLSKAIERMKLSLKEKGLNSLEEEAEAIFNEDQEMCQMMAVYGLTLLPNKSEYKFITHCNTGSLATAGIGTALGLIKFLAGQKKKVKVFATETRPYLQGSRLTAWELNKCQIPVTLMPDSATAYLMSKENIDAVFVGADRIVANGDTANKIGTYTLALLAREFKIPFYVVAPSTSIDLSLSSGAEIEIEQRESSELTEFNGLKIAPSGIEVFNPSFDITPGNLITAFITEKGILNIEKLKNIL